MYQHGFKKCYRKWLHCTKYRNFFIFFCTSETLCKFNTHLVSKWGENEAGLSCSENKGMEPPISHSRKDMMITTWRDEWVGAVEAILQCSDELFKASTYSIWSQTVNARSRGCLMLVFIYTFHCFWDTPRRAPGKPLLLCYTSRHRVPYC